MFTSIPVFYLLDGQQHYPFPLPPSCDTKNVSRHCQVSPGGKYCTCPGTVHCCGEFKRAVVSIKEGGNSQVIGNH